MAKKNRHSTSASRQVLFGVLIIAAILLAGYGGISYMVLEEIDTVCADALREYPGDRVEALITSLNTGSPGYRERHRVVWTLGELRDRRALSALESLLRDDRFDRYEVKKALKKITGEILDPYFWKKISGK